jgi:hypothetical protein
VNTTVKSRLFLSSLVLVGLAMVAPHLGGPHLGGALLSGPRLGDAATQRDPARIVVRADRALASVSPSLFGQNHGPWMNTTAGYVADYREAGVTLLRFPAGNWGDENDLLYAHWGTTQVDAESSDEALLPAFASLHDDGRLAILVVNKDPLEAWEAALTVEGFRPAGQARVWLQDEEHLAEELPAIAVAETFSHIFPPYSVTLFILEPVPQGRWLLWASLGLLAFALVTLGVLRYRVRSSR